ncbi:hypothetical protein [Prochlorococcus marinus]|uniref:hypothetical protein n=1 Tax=Prochlorococcus marinus TaxID=1219 RepID=UPI0022B39B6A|nr:hypothetical protein [Prochlorococcus marinus]
MPDPIPQYILIAPVGQLCGNGQLRETISERRNRQGNDVPFWYLSSDLVQKFNISTSNFEAVVSDQKTAIIWLQLRFGGEIINKKLDLHQLRQSAMELPPAAAHRDISITD